MNKHRILLAGLALGAFAGLAFSQLSSVPRNLPGTPGPSKEQSARGRVAWRSGVLALGDPQFQNDFPEVTVDRAGRVWAVWTAWSALREAIQVRRFADGTWYSRFDVPGVTGSVWHPQVAEDRTGGMWVVWAQDTNYSTLRSTEPNWDLYAARVVENEWGKPIRLTDDPAPDINHHLLADDRGRLWLAWQGFRNGQSDIFLRSYENDAWGEPRQVSSNPADDWNPIVAVDSAGNGTVVWDSYRNGNYDLYLRHWKDNELGPRTPVAQSALGQMNAAAVYDTQDRLWIAYDEVNADWGKDNGGRTLRFPSPGKTLGDERTVRVRVLENGLWKQPRSEVDEALLPSERSLIQAPRLYADAAGRVWLLFRQRVDVPETRSLPYAGMPLDRGLNSYWRSSLTYYNGDAWAAVTPMPHGRDRISSLSSGAPAPNGQFWAVWHTDNRDDSQAHYPGPNQVWSAVFTPPSAPEPTRLTSETVRRIDPGLDRHPREAADIEAIRGYRTTYQGSTYSIYRGDLHRHTEFSTDDGGRRDGSVWDFFRYVLNAANLDFGAITDHQAGADIDYWWWITQKVTDMYQVPGRYTALFGYERTPMYPFGHRNVIHPVRNVPAVRFHFRPDNPERYLGSSTAAEDLVDNDTELLYDAVRKTGGITIPHTSASVHGTDWRSNDRTVEPVVEIYQGQRASSEHAGAPAAVADDGRNAGKMPRYQPAGFVWNAWEKGYRIGVISSSDHNSTHLSYAMVYSDTASREGLIEAIRRRHTYAATDNIIVDFRMGSYLMGDDFEAAAVPDLKIYIRGTAPVETVSIIRNQTYITQQSPGSSEVSFTFRDADPLPGTSYYYIRVEQSDGNIAWSSPIWITVR